MQILITIKPRPRSKRVTPADAVDHLLNILRNSKATPLAAIGDCTVRACGGTFDGIESTINILKQQVDAGKGLDFQACHTLLNLLQPEADVYACADCGKEFYSGEERDKHYMSPACPKLGK